MLTRPRGFDSFQRELSDTMGLPEAYCCGYRVAVGVYRSTSSPVRVVCVRVCVPR